MADTAEVRKTLPDRNNSFGFTRVVAASGVIVSHHFPIAGYEEPRLYSFSLGGLSVYIFFLTSGYLISKSVMANPDSFRFTSARFLRIIPNLSLVLFLTSIATFIYYQNTAHWVQHLRYVLQNLAMLVRGGPYHVIPGVFADRPMQALNGSLWSLPYEVWCYFILFGLLKAPTPWRKNVILGTFAACCLVWWLPDVRFFPFSIYSGHLASLGGWFFAGASFAVLARPIPLLSSPRMAWFAKTGDPSYGMYIFAWPVQQFCTAAIVNFWTSLAVSFVIIVALGYATWHGFEKAAMAKTDDLAGWLRARLTRR